MDPGYPRFITQDFPGIGSKVDAAFENYGETNSPLIKTHFIQVKSRSWLKGQQCMHFI